MNQLDGKLNQMQNADKEYSEVSDFDDPSLRVAQKTKLKSLVDTTTRFKDDLKKKLADLKAASERSKEQQKKLDSFEDNVRAINRQVASMLESSDLPSPEGREAFAQLPQHKTEMQKVCVM